MDVIQVDARRKFLHNIHAKFPERERESLFSKYAKQNIILN